MLRKKEGDGDKSLGVLQGGQARQHRDAFTEQRSGSPPLHLHSLQRSALEFEVPASLFADFPGKGSFGLDQEMSLLSHVELNSEAKREERSVLGKLRPATNCCWWRDPPFALTAASN